MNAKYIGIFVIVLLIAGGYGAYHLLSNIDDYVKQAIEEAGTEATGTRVSVTDVAIDLTSGRGELSGITVANPPGFTDQNLFELGSVALQLNLSSLTGPVVIIEEISIDGATLNVEQKGLNSNVKDLYDNLKDQGGDSAAESSSEDTRLAVEEFNFTNTQVNFLTEKQGEHSMPFPDIRETGIGDTDTGLTPEQLARRLMMSVTKRLRGATQDYVEEQLKDRGKDAAMKKLEEKIGEDRSEMLRGLLGVKSDDKDKETKE